MENESLFNTENPKAVETKIIEKENTVSPVEIKQLVVSPAPLRMIALGEVKGIVDITDRKKEQIDAIVWNEREIKLILNQGTDLISFQPEFESCSEMFFQREEKRDGMSLFGEEKGVRIWEGDYEPIQFGKSNLIKFLKKYASYFEPEIEKSIKNMKVTERKIEDSEMLSLDDDDNVRTVTEETKNTNIPRSFKAMMPLFGGFEVELDFEACVTKKTDRYGNAKNKNVIELRVVNAREAIRQTMEEILNKFPEKIPKYYGRTDVHINRSRY